MEISNRRSALFAGRRDSVDHGTIIGAIAAFGLVIIAIYLGGNLSSFWDLNSIIIVVGGTFGATLINFPFRDLTQTLSALKSVFFPDPIAPQDRIDRILSLALNARKNGHLSMQSELNYESDLFVRKCIELAVDDVPMEDVRRILDTELSFQEDKHRRGAQLLQAMGTVAPAMGLIGTLIGLVQMLQHLDDPNKIGPAMGLALLTTFYGAMLANVIFIPLAGKLIRRSEEEQRIKELTAEGIIDIARGINPRLVEQKLFGFLAPEERISRFA